MPPGKRKRSEQPTSPDEVSSRPSPYRPEKARLSGGTSGGTQNAEVPSDGEDTGVTMAANTDAAVDMPANGVSHDESSSDPTAAIASASATTLRFSPLAWNYITDDVRLAWATNGLQTVREHASGTDATVVAEMVQELVWSGLNGRLSGQQAGAGVREAIAACRHANVVDVQSLFLNMISLLDDADFNNAHLRAMIAATGIDPQVMRQELDIPLLQSLNLVRSTFEKMRTRKTTNALYRQANFNLLREESEGYAKLITEYFNTAQEASSRREEDPFMAEDAFQRVKALVGAFDLDVGRVLDITLDVSANLLVKAYPFFMKFYRASTWWPDNGLLDHIKWEDQGFSVLPKWALPRSGRSSASLEDKAQLAILRERRDIRFWDQVREVGIDAFFDIGSRWIVDFDSVAPLLEREIAPELDGRGKENDPNKRQRINEDRKYMLKTRTLPPLGSYDAAQLLGFKLRFYASPARDASDSLPDNLVYLVALLIKIGFLSLRDLYPHLHPPDGEMPQEKIRLEKEKVEKEAKDRPGVGTNALTIAGALTDDTIPAPRIIKNEKDRSGGGSTPSQDKKDEPKEDLPPPGNQKILLLKALLLIGALPEALHILGRFPWLVEVDTAIPQYLHRIANHMLSKVAASTRPLSDRSDLQDPKNWADPAGKHILTHRLAKKATRWLYNDGFDKDGQEYRHYYADWSDNIPVCQSIDHVVLMCNTVLGFIGVKIGHDATLYGTLLRIAKHSLIEDTSAWNQSRWLELMRRLLVPALSLTEHNPELAADLYELLKLFPTITRYNIYAEWFTGRTSRQPDVRAAFNRNKLEVRDVLRRVSNDTGKKQSRALSKVSYSSPGIVMMEMINQLESYSNMIPSLVECTRYFSLLAYDILTWWLINSLGGQGRNRMQSDGMLTSAWLQALSQFVASLFARYSHLDPSPVLQYLASELRAGNSTDLQMLEQILVEMAGIRSDVEFNDAQVLAMAGGEHLQNHILHQLSDTRLAKTAPAKRLMRALAEPGLIGPTVIAIAQERQMYAHHESSRFMPLKVLGNNLDKIQAVFAQYIEVLRYNLTPDEFEKHVPDVISLIVDFGIEPGAAFTICRTAIRHRMSQLEPPKEPPKKLNVDEKRDQTDKAQPDTTIDGLGNNGTSVLANTEQSSGGTPGPNAESDSPMSSAEQSKNRSMSQPAVRGPWHPALESIIERVSESLPELHSRVSIPFYVTFWTLTHQDVLVPTDSYAKELRRIEAQVTEIQRDRSDVSAIVARERDRKKKALLEAYDRIKNETTPHISAYYHVKKRISNNEKDHWFLKPGPNQRNESKQEIDAKHLGLLQDCFLPRAMMSSLDAHYAFQMLKLLHDNGTPGFSLMHLLHHLFRKSELAALMFQCTAMEAQHFGRFLCETLKHLHRWHGDKAIYEKEAFGDKKKLPGFVKKFDANGEPKVVMDYEDFRRMLYNFHAFLNLALQSCFESGEYMHIRNGIIVLRAVHQVFPALKFMGKNMVDHVRKISDDDSRQDLKLAARSLLGHLKSREKNWVLPQAFRMNAQDATRDSAKSESRPSSAKPETRPSESDPKLNATAPEFKPASTSESNGPPRKESVAGREDGEIEDEKQSPARDADVEMKDLPATDTSKAPTSTPAEGTGGKDSQRPPTTNGEQTPSSHTTQSAQQDPKPSTPKPTPASTTPSANGPSRPESARMPAQEPRSRPLESNFAADSPHLTTGPRGRGRYGSRGDLRSGRLEHSQDVRFPGPEPSSGTQPRARTPPNHAGRGPLRDDRQLERPPVESRSSRDTNWPPSHLERSTPSARPLPDMRERSNIGSRVEDASDANRSGRFSSVAVGQDYHSSPRDSFNGPPAPPSRVQEDAHQAYPPRRNLINEPPANGSSLRRPREGTLGEREPYGGRDINAEDRANTPRSSRIDNRPNGRFAESPRDQIQTEPPVDMGYSAPKRGRLSRDTGPVPESTYGRLNGPQDMPPGPRQQTGPHERGRTFTPTQPANTARQNDPYVAAPPGSRQPGPPVASRAANARQTGPPHDRPATPNSAPTTPADENGPRVHPSRVQQLAQPSGLQTNFPASHSANDAGSPTTGPPSGPRLPPQRAPAGSPTGPSGSANFPPAGVPTSAERQRRGERQRANINATLQGANSPAGPLGGQGVNFRGASSRNPNSPGMSPADSRPAVPTVASSMEPPPTRSPRGERPPAEQFPVNQPSARPDLFQDRGPRDGAGVVGSKRGAEEGIDRAPGVRDIKEPRLDNNGSDPPPLRLPPGEDRGSRGPPTRGFRDDRSGPPPPRDLRPSERSAPPPRGVGAGPPPRRLPPSETPASFAGAAEWDPPAGNSYGRGPPRRDGPGPPDGGNRRGRGGSRGGSDDFRASGPRREYDTRTGPGFPPGGVPDDGGLSDGGKRRHDDGPPPPFDPTRRRRGGPRQ